MIRSAHLSKAEFVALLATEPDNQNLTHVKNHLDSCENCQAALQRIAADDWWWNEGNLLFSSTVKLVEDFRAAQGDNESSRKAVFDLVGAEIGAIVDHLEPALHPELLGQVDGYQVESVIGVGGMGIVFKAFDQALNRPVAIKFLLPRLASQGIARQRFSREAKAVAAICHKNVIPILRINTSWIYPFFVMPYVSGISLQQLVESEGALDPQQLVQIACQIAGGLSAAHSRGMIHRDIKPANILLENRCNRVVITDFGLVHDENEQGLTQTGIIAGTPHYMSPEQAAGKPLDSRTDLFSLGSVMYWMATGKTPFSGSSQFELLNRLQTHAPSGIRSNNPEIPSVLETAILKLLDKEPANRFETAEALENYLNRYVAHFQNPVAYPEPVMAQPASPEKPLWRWIGALSFVLLLGLGTILTFLNRENPGLVPSPNVHVQEKKSQTQETQDKSKDRVVLSKADIKQLKSLARKKPMQIRLNVDRNTVGLHDRVVDGVSRLEPKTFERLWWLYQNNQEGCQSIWKQWRSEAQRKYGRMDLFVAEPVLLRAQLFVHEREWKLASGYFRTLSSILKNNFAEEELLHRVDAIAAACAKEPGKNGPKVLQQRIVEAIYPRLSSEFRERLQRIGCLKEDKHSP